MCLSATGSPPRRTCARRSLALARAAPMSSNAVEPSVTRRLLPPRSYCTTQLREPPSRRRSPKPPSSSSQKVLSFVPGGSTSALAAVVVSFTRCPPAGQVMGTFALRPPAISCYRRIRGMASCVSSLQALACSCTLLRRLYPNRSESRCWPAPQRASSQTRIAHGERLYSFGDVRVATLALLIFTALSGWCSWGVVMTKFSGHVVTFRSSPTVFADTPVPTSASTRILAGKPPRAMSSAAVFLHLYRGIWSSLIALSGHYRAA